MKLQSLIFVFLFLSGCAESDRIRVHNARSDNQTDELPLALNTSRSRLRGRQTAELRALPNKGISQTTYNEAQRCKEFYLSKKNYYLAERYIEHLITMERDHIKLSNFLLQLADIYLVDGNIEKALTKYQEFKTLYPGSPLIKYVMFKELLAYEYSMYDFHRDQQKTKIALQRAFDFLKEFPEDTDYKDRVQQLIDKCYLSLFKHDLELAQFYITQYNYQSGMHNLRSAQSRIETILKHYLPHLEDKELTSELSHELVSASPGTSHAVLEKILHTLITIRQKYDNKAQQKQRIKRHPNPFEKPDDPYLEPIILR